MAADPENPLRLYVLERDGHVRLIDDDMLAAQPVIDLRNEVTAEGLEQGLLGIALHPQFGQNRRVFLYWTDHTNHMVLAEFRASPEGNEFDIGTRHDILVIDDPHPTHNGGQILFGPDGFLYLGVGDGGLLPGGWRDGRDPSSLLGKILRLDVDHESTAGAYSIPPGQPFVGTPDARPEVWAIGLRNPWRFSLDPITDNLWIADVGQLKWEEIDVLPRAEAAGANFGWNMYEGPQCFERPVCDPTGITQPAFAYPHSGGNCAVVGGLVYRRPDSRLYGQYLMGDYCSGRIWTIAADTNGSRMELQLDTELLITSFGSATDGSVYLTAQDGQLFRVTGAP